MRPKIFIAIQYLELGGVERSLIGLLEAIDYSRYEVDLFVYRHSGELMQFIPKEVNLIPEIDAYTTLTRPIKAIVHEGYYGIALGRLWAKYKAWRFGKLNKAGENYSVFQYVADATTKFLPSINNTVYDLAISFLTPHNIVRDKVNAKRKAAWIHTDYSNIAIDAKCELKSWSTFDYIASISGNAKEAFISKFPSLASKVTVIENILSEEFVRQQSMLEKPELNGEINILTVGRFCYPKALDNAVRICAELIKMGLPIKWYAIGYGDEQTIKDAIKECSMEDYFIILGKKSNPYPYIAACDIYVQPSRYEGKAVTVREAQILRRPVVITAFSTSMSQLSDGFDGIIVPQNILEAAKGIKSLIENRELQNIFRKNMAITDYGNTCETEKIYKMI